MATVPTLPLLVLVDDAPEIGVIVKHLGVRAGQDVRVYEDVAGAWDFLTRARPDLLIVDLNLSGENGLVLCRRVRATPAFTQLAVALFTNWDRPEDVIAGLEAGIPQDAWERAEPVDIDAPVLRVDTTDGYRPGLDEVAWLIGRLAVPIE